MDEDIATGKRIARQCKQMSIATFVAALDVEFAQGAYVSRFDSEDGSTAMMEATITALLAYMSAGGTLDNEDNPTKHVDIYRTNKFR